MKSFFEEINKKKVIMIGVFLLVIIIILFGVAFIYNKFFLSVTYQEAEQIMKEAAIEYYKKNSEELPSVNNKDTVITDTELVNAGLMESINEQVRASGYTCDGKVIVTNINGNYRYNPILECGDKYQTYTLVDYINNNVAIVDSGNGLYNMNNELVYRGDKVNNYVKISDKYYRIVKIVDDHLVVILSHDSDSVVWDNRYNIDKKSSIGINDYTVSRMRDYLNNLYNGETLLSNSSKLLVASYDLKIGSRVNNTTDKTGEVENAVVLENQYIGLLPVYDFMNASIDENCVYTTSRSCVNYNYLSKYDNSWWTSTSYGNNSYNVYKIVNGSASLANANSSAYIRPVLHLVDDVVYVSGNGTADNPYIIK